MSQRFRTISILWFALLVSVGLYAAVLIFLRSSPHALPTDFAHSASANTSLAVLGLAACLAAVASLLVPGLLLKRTLSRLGGSSDNLTSGLDSDSGSITLREFAAYNQTFIVGMALSDSVAVFGFILGYLGFRLSVVAPFFVVCALLMLTRFPSKQRMMRALDKARAAGSSYESSSR